MKRCLFALVLVLGVASAASAATLTMVPDQASYLPGDTVTITFTADPQGGTAGSLYGLFSFDPSILISIPPTVPPQIFEPDGIVECGDGLCEAFDQLVGPFPSDPFIVTVPFLAVGPGTTQLEWTELDFFGLTNAPGTTVTVVPEPVSAALLALGLALAAKRVRTRA